MSNPTNPNAQSSSERSIRSPSPRTRALLEAQALFKGDHAPIPEHNYVHKVQKTEKAAPNTYREKMEAQEAQENHEREMRYKCDPIKGACGCELRPCNIALGGPPSLLPFLAEPHFFTMMRNAIYQHPFKHKDHFENIHKILGIDPTPEKTADEVRKVARIPWLLSNPYSPLPNKLELLIRRAIQNDTELTDDDRRHCYRMLGMDEHSIAERDRLKDCPTCPTCGTPKGYRLDGCTWVALKQWRPRPVRSPETYQGPYQYGQSGLPNDRPRRQPTAANSSPFQGQPTGSIGPIVDSIEMSDDPF